MRIVIRLWKTGYGAFAGRDVQLNHSSKANHGTIARHAMRLQKACIAIGGIACIASGGIIWGGSPGRHASVKTGTEVACICLEAPLGGASQAGTQQSRQAQRLFATAAVRPNQSPVQESAADSHTGTKLPTLGSIATCAQGRHSSRCRLYPFEETDNSVHNIAT
eukprot:scaffold44963_cov20-Tisochrysis_lutea.AAC.2